MNIILFDSPIHRKQLLPLAFTKPISEFRVGILTIAEKWQKRLLASQVSYQTEAYLSIKYPLKVEVDNIWINGSLIPDNQLIDAIETLSINNALVKDGVLLAYRGEQFLPTIVSEYPYKIVMLNNLWDIFMLNSIEIQKDFLIITHGRKSTICTDIFTAIYGDNIFIEENVNIKASVFNTETGPIYIGKNVKIKPGSLIEGPFAICENSVLNMGSKIRGGTTIGPNSVIGGEVNNSVIFANSNKGHEGYLGNAVIGEWCNLGADTNNSNLKNNFSNVKVWNYKTESSEDCGSSKCDLFMGDHSKSGINTMFNSGTVVGVGVNVFGSNFQSKFIPSFAWGDSNEVFKISKFDEMVTKWMNSKNQQYNEIDKSILHHIYMHNDL